MSRPIEGYAAAPLFLLLGAATEPCGGRLRYRAASYRRVRSDIERKG